MNSSQTLIGKFVTFIIDPAILVVFSLGFFLFVWGLIEFLWRLNSGGDNKEGKQHMIWGIVGMLIMISVYGIIAMLDNSFNLDIRNPDISRAGNITYPQVFK